jgi:hypothetical protein
MDAPEVTEAAPHAGHAKTGHRWLDITRGLSDRCTAIRRKFGFF